MTPALLSLATIAVMYGGIALLAWAVWTAARALRRPKARRPEAVKNAEYLVYGGSIR